MEAMVSNDPIIDVATLSKLSELSDAVLFDARPGSAGAASYKEGHLAGAVHVDLEGDLSGPADAPAQGGRHPLPDVRTFCEKLGQWGVARDSEVVVYDDQGGANSAARFWWLLRALGHARVRVLDGGLAAAVEAGLPLVTSRTAPSPVAPYPASDFGSGLANHDDVDAARLNPERCVLDVRSAARFRGDEEPIDPIAGHIPGAINLPLQANLDEGGRFKSAVVLRAQYVALLDDRAPEALIVHCGSGVTACHSLLALERAGLGGARLYVGSWSEWCRNDWPREP